MIADVTPLDLLRLAQAEFKRFDKLASQGRQEMFGSVELAQQLVAEAVDRLQDSGCSDPDHSAFQRNAPWVALKEF